MISCNVLTDGVYKEIGKISDIQTFDNRMVAFLDVLGFKEMILNSKLVDAKNKYEKLLSIIREVNSLCSNNSKKYCNIYVFSDSIFLFANGDDDKDVKDFILGLWKILQISICCDFDMPLRGGISYGPVYINDIEKIYMGNPIVNAVKLESQQDWIGVACDEYAYNRWEKIVYDGEAERALFSAIMVKYPVPLKNGNNNINIAINWRFNVIAKDGIKSLLRNEKKRDDIEKKIYNTLNFLRYIKEIKALYINEKNVPEELKKTFSCIYIGDEMPPFADGDGDEDEY